MLYSSASKAYNHLSILVVLTCMMLAYSGTAQETDQNQEMTEVLVSKVEEVPVFPGCEKFETREERKTCLANSISQYMNRNFDTRIVKKKRLTGMNRMEARFRITASGEVEIIEVLATHPALKEEVERVLKSFPTMTPGVHKGNKVSVEYILPMSFSVTK